MPSILAVVRTGVLVLFGWQVAPSARDLALGSRACKGARMVHGLLLAAGAGRRMGAPKALVRDADGTSWLLRSVTALREGGCDRVTVVLGAAADEAGSLLAGQDVEVVVAEGWAEGMGASLRAGLSAVAASDDLALLLTLVDLPDVGPRVVRRLVGLPVTATTLARAAYDGTPGHPVVIGREHWAGVAAEAHGDQGARAYLSRHTVDLVECGDLATGRDVDAPTDVR
jgi:CTP:molybdopterin cytidylyltransferase MocA